MASNTATPDGPTETTSAPPKVPLVPSEIGLKIMEFDALNCIGTDLKETHVATGYERNFDSFVTRWQRYDPCVLGLPKTAFLSVRVQNVRPQYLAAHQPFALPFGTHLFPQNIALTPRILPSFDFVRRLQIGFVRSRPIPIDSAIDKIFAVCPCLRELHVVLRGLEFVGYPLGAVQSALVGALRWIDSRETALRANNTVAVKTLDFCPEFIGRSQQGAPYDSTNPRGVRIGAWDTRSYLEQVQPLQMNIDEFASYDTGINLLSAMYHLAYLKEYQGFDVKEFRWAFRRCQEVPSFLARAAWTHSKCESIIEPELRLKLSALMEDAPANGLHWTTHRPGREN